MESTLNAAEKARIPTPDEKALITRQQVGVINAYLGRPIVATTNLISTAADWADGARVIAAQPDVPRNLTALLADANASILTGVLTITGVDAQGRTVVETMTVAAGVGLAFTGTKIFARVDSAVCSGTTGVINAGADQLIIGVGTLIGLPVDIERAAEVLHAYLDARVAVPVIQVGVSKSAVDVSAATYNGAKTMWVIVQPTRRVVA
jgi:hypothetical protein